MNGPVERSKEALDELYSLTSPQSAAINSRLKSYDSERLRSEIKYCLELVDQIVSAEGRRNLRSIVFATQTTNSFPTVFSAIFLAIHEISFKNGHVLANAVGAQAALNNVQTKLNTSRNALSTVERRKNINLVKGLIQDCFVTGDVSKVALGRRRELDKVT